MSSNNKLACFYLSNIFSLVYFFYLKSGLTWVKQHFISHLIAWKYVVRTNALAYLPWVSVAKEKKFCKIGSCGLYYKHLTIVNNDSSVISKWNFKLIDNPRVVIYDHHRFIIQATGYSLLKPPYGPIFLVEKNQSLANCVLFFRLWLRRR